MPLARQTKWLNLAIDWNTLARPESKDRRVVWPSSQTKDKRQTDEWFNVLTISGFVNIESRMIHTVDIETSRNHSSSDHFLVINSSGEKNFAHSRIQLLSRDEGLDVQSAKFVTRAGVELQLRGQNDTYTTTTLA